MIKIFGLEISEKIIYTVLVLTIGYLIYKVLLNAVNKLFDNTMAKVKTDHRRQKTLKNVINSAIKYSFGFVVIVSILGVLGVNASALIASVGVIGLTIGLAFQDLLKDVIAGIFIIIENRYTIGDIVMIGTFQGEVTFLGLKSTKLVSATGEMKIISNRNILEITNYSLNSLKIYTDIDLAYDNDEILIEKTFQELTTKLSKNVKHIRTDVKYLGVQKIGDKITYRLCFETGVKHQDSVKDEAWREIKKVLDKNEIRR